MRWLYVQIKVRLLTYSFLYLTRWATCRLKKRHRADHVIYLMDAYGRLANRLTTVANTLAYAHRVNAIVVDLTFFDLYGESLWARNLDDCEGRIVHRRHKSLGWMDRFCLSCLVRLRVPNTNLVDRNREGASHGVSFFSAKYGPRLALAHNWLDGVSDSLLITGVHVDLQEPMAEEVGQLRRVMLPGGADFDFSAWESPERSVGQADVCRIGVHVRHGDYKTWREGTHYFTIEQYIDFVKSVEQASSGRVCEFFFVSDNLEVEDALREYSNMHWSGKTEDSDLLCLASCDLILATNSSFARWASFIGDVPISLIDPFVSGESPQPHMATACVFPLLD